jgi:hypothetical protein
MIRYPALATPRPACWGLAAAILFMSTLFTSAVFTPAPALGGISEQIYLPSAGNKVRSGVRMEIETDWVSGCGYLPVKVTMFNAPAGPTTYDRDFRVRITPRSYGNKLNIVTEAIVELPENSTQGAAWIAVPRYANWDTLNIEVTEGGERIDELSEAVDFNVSGTFWGNQGPLEAVPSLLVIDRDVPNLRARHTLIQNQVAGILPKTPTYDLPDVRLWQTIVPLLQPPYMQTAPGIPNQPVSRNQVSDAETLTFVRGNEKVVYLPPSELSDQWLHYSGVDIVCITLADLHSLAQDSPPQWQAIRTWLRTGPLLIVAGVGSDFEQLSSLETLLDFPRTSAIAAVPLSDEHPAWTPALVNFRDDQVRSLTGMSNNNQAYRYTPDANDLGIENGPASSGHMTADDNPPFAVREYGLGKVAALNSPDLLQDPPNSMAWLLNQVGSHTWMQYQRQGISYTWENSDFMTFLIEGTGRVPVMSFIVLITLFVIVIGPVNYLLLRRWKRLFVLLVTVPVGAAIVTIGLFTYALVSDGLGVRARARSVTHLDQRTGQMECLARQTYYAGLAPSGGLTFPLDTAVFPIEERPWTQGESAQGHRRQLIWTDDEQQLRSGYLRSREPTQFLLVRSAESTKKLDLQSPGPGELAATNHLGVKIQQVVARDAAGNYFQGSELVDGAQQKLTPAADYNAAVKSLSVVYNDNRPALPLGYDMSASSVGLFGFRESYNYNSYHYRRNSNGFLPPPSFHSSILESLLRYAAVGHAGLEPGSYFALVEKSPEMPIGCRQVTEQGSFHAVLGHW